VTASSDSTVVLIVDDDVAFLIWLGELFAELRCQAVPALHCRQALALATRFQLPVGTLVVNPKLRGAARMVQLLVAENPGARVVLICDSALHHKGTHPVDSEPRNSSEPRNGNQPRNGSPDRRGIRARLTLQRPLPGEQISHAEWIARIRKTLPVAAAR
jgi:hypothetical protein